MIVPSVGRVVWYRPDDSTVRRIEERFAAHVARVHEDGTVNLMVIDPSGIPFARQYVTLVQDGQVPSPGQCEWMPYQKAVASGQQAPNLHVGSGG